MKFQGWDVLEVIPEGWAIDKTAGSPLSGSVFITNRKSVLNGQKRALLKISKCDLPLSEIAPSPIVERQIAHKEKPHKFPSRSFNDLARKKFQEKLLQEILFDLSVCEIEGWDKREYIQELKELINGIGRAP